MCPRNVQSGNPVDHVDSQVEPVDLICHGQFQRRVDVPVLLVSAHVQILVAVAPVCELVNQPRIAVKVEDNGFVRCEQAVEITIRQTVLVLARGL